MLHGSGTPVLIDFGWPREDLIKTEFGGEGVSP
jgi:hypothetical protein